jgi:hypothetical protein
MVEITLFEIHLDEATFTANAPFSAAESTDGIDDETASDLLPGGTDVADADDDDAGAPDARPGGKGPLPAILALGLVLVLVLVGRRILGGEPEPVPE